MALKKLFFYNSRYILILTFLLYETEVTGFRQVPISFRTLSSH
jgi:hypothetical protein